MYKQQTDTVGRKDRRVIIETWGTTQDIGGGPQGSVVSSYPLWANVENKDGRIIQGEDQRLWPYNFKIEVRYEKSRPINVAQTVLYDGGRLNINSVSIDREGMRWEVILKCSSVGQAGPNIVGPGQINSSEVKDFGFTATDFIFVWSDPALINKKIVGAFKDGIEFQVLITGTPTGKQVLYEASLGQFTWGLPYEPGEYSLIQYI